MMLGFLYLIISKYFFDSAATWQKISIGAMSLWAMLFILFAAAFAYAFTHNGLRNTLLWIFMAIIFSLRYGKPSGALPGDGLRKE